MERTKHKAIVRIVSTSAALLLLVVCGSLVSREAKSGYPVLEQEQRNWGPQIGRKLLESNGSGADNPYCHHPMHQNNSCHYVKDFCSDDVALVNYLAIVACSMPGVKVS